MPVQPSRDASACPSHDVLRNRLHSSAKRVRVLVVRTEGISQPLRDELDPLLDDLRRMLREMWNDLRRVGNSAGHQGRCLAHALRSRIDVFEQALASVTERWRSLTR